MTAEEIIRKLLEAIDEVGDYNDGCHCCASTTVSKDSSIQSVVAEAEAYLAKAKAEA